MKNAARQIILSAAALLVCCFVIRAAFFDHLNIYIPLYEDGQPAPEIRLSNPDVMRLGETEIRSGYVRIPVWPESAGETDLIAGAETDSAVVVHSLYADSLRTVYDRNTGNFTGDSAVLISLTLFWLLLSAIMLWHFLQAKGADFYDYGTIYYSGFSLFALATGLVLLSVTVSHLIHPEQYSMFDAYSAMSSASKRYMQLTTPLMLLFAAVMAISNIALLRHERPRIQNVLGLLVSVLLVAGEAIGWYLFTRDFMGSETQVRISTTVENVYATVFVYFQCMLTGSMICGLLSARHEPAPDKDFIIILGCWFRPDGSLPPLLRGRADRALAFWRRQKEATGKEARFVPSGGQGRNETMAEGEAIRQYLLSQGIEDRLILPERRSVNTFQNMEFSKQIILLLGGGGKTVFATSSYHVFRSGLWARKAGLSAEGMGGKTKWWFWPNAFMRETAGLFQRRWKQELVFLLLLIVIFGVLSLAL